MYRKVFSSIDMSIQTSSKGGPPLPNFIKSFMTNDTDVKYEGKENHLQCI